MAHVYVWSGATGAGTGADWTNAYTTLAAALTAKAAGDNFWVAHDHAETQAASMTLSAPGTGAAPNTIMCVNRLGTVPPASGDERTTATITTTGAFGVTINSGIAYCYGITFNSGSGAVANPIVINAAWTFDTCVLAKLGTSAATNAISFTNLCTLKNTNVQLGVSGDGFRVTNGLRWIGGSLLTATTTLITNYSATSGYNYFQDVDLSLISSSYVYNSATSTTERVISFINCKMSSASIEGSIGIFDVVNVINSDSSGTNYRAEKHTYSGISTTDTGLVLTGGASDGTTAFSSAINAASSNAWTAPFEHQVMAVWNDTTATTKTVTVECIQDPRTSTALPSNGDVWLEVSYMGSATSPLETIATTGKADYLAATSTTTASTAAWDSLITARANSTAYTVGTRIKTASNAGRVFVCTTAGTSAASEPAGYATAVDGGAVTDGTAVFTAAVRFKLSLTLSTPQPALKGLIKGKVKIAKVSGIYNVDRKLQVA